MFMLSDSGDECYDSYMKSSRRSVKRRRSKTLTNKEPVEIIDLCGVVPVSSCVSSISNRNVVSESKDYSSSDLFLNDSISDTEKTTSKSKGRSKPSPAKPARGRSKGGGRGRGRGKKRSTDSLSEIPPTASPIFTDYEKDEQISFERDQVMSLLTPEPPNTTKRGKKRGRQSTQGSTNSPVNSGGRSRGGRGRKRGRGTATLRRSIRQSIPIFNIGNCDEYTDSSENQQLFTSSNKEPVIIDIDEDVHNEELSVKVHWQSLEVIKFTIRRLQKITQIFDFFMERENVSLDQLLFMYNNDILRPDNTPDSINYNIAKFIEGGIVHTKLALPSNMPESKTSNFKLKFQSQSMKRPLEISINETDKLQLGMVKCAEHLELPLSKLKFEFDGDIVRGNKTPADLDIVSGDCIDVKIINC